MSVVQRDPTRPDFLLQMFFLRIFLIQIFTTKAAMFQLFDFYALQRDLIYLR